TTIAPRRCCKRICRAELARLRKASGASSALRSGTALSVGRVPRPIATCQGLAPMQRASGALYSHKQHPPIADRGCREREGAMRKARWCALLVGAVLLASSGGGSNTTSSDGTSPPPDPPDDTPSGCDGSCADASSYLTPADIGKAIAQAVGEARAQATPATIAIVDRLGNVLAVYRMAGASPLVTITSNRGVTGGLENLVVPSELAAIAKAVTGAYLSSEGN